MSGRTDATARAQNHPWTGYTSPLLEQRLADLFAMARAMGVTVQPKALSRTRYGQFSLTTNVIALNEVLHAHQAVDALAHELMHATHRDAGNSLEQEGRANRGAVSLLVNEAKYVERFDPRRHLFRSPDQNRQEVIDLFGCGFLAMKWRHAMDPDCRESWCPAHLPRRSL